jgi:hypothetical protein
MCGSKSGFPRSGPYHFTLRRCRATGQANRCVLEYGRRLLPRLYQGYNPMPSEAAREMEVELAFGLREARYAVWQA